MSENNCSSFGSCKLVKKDSLGLTEKTREEYIQNYCLSQNRAWETCRRFECRKALHFCPDFVLPDTALSLDEIIEQFDTANY